MYTWWWKEIRCYKLTTLSLNKNLTICLCNGSRSLTSLAWRKDLCDAIIFCLKVIKKPALRLIWLHVQQYHMFHSCSYLMHAILFPLAGTIKHTYVDKRLATWKTFSIIFTQWEALCSQSITYISSWVSFHNRIFLILKPLYAQTRTILYGLFCKWVCAAVNVVYGEYRYHSIPAKYNKGLTLFDAPTRQSLNAFCLKL